MTEVFEGVTVLDFSWGWPGSIATMILSDFGAEVIKVEPPGGDPFRAWPASLQWNRGKKSVILDLKSPEGRSQARQLATRSDVVVTSFRPGVAERLGIDYGTLAAERPDLIYFSITGFGPKGPYANYKGYDAAVAAKIGRMMVGHGQSRNDGPQYMAVNISSHAAAMAAVRGITAGLIVREKTGLGQKAETSLLQACVTYDLTNWSGWQMMLKHPELYPENPFENPRRQPTPGYMPVRTKDGHWIQMGSLVERPFRQYMHVLGLGFIYDDPRFRTAPRLLPADQETLRNMIMERAQERTMDEWMDIFIHGDPSIAAEPYMTPQEGMNHPQMIHNGHIQDVHDPRVGRMRQLGPLVYAESAPGSIKGPAPEPGQHTREVLGRLNSAPPKAPSYGSAPLPKYPLDGITVLDFTSVIAGPLGCSLVAQLGARVIHFEVKESDYMRQNNRGLAINSTMGGAENISLDLKAPECLELVLKMAAKADLVVNNMRPGAPERLGIGYEQLKKINPNLIYVYAAGYGSSGPHSHRPAMHPTMGAVCGGALAQLGRDVLPPADQPLTLEEKREFARRLMAANETNPDPNSAGAISVACLMGLYLRERTGKGQYLESTMLCANAYANADDFFWYDGKPPRQIPDGAGYGLHALHRLYRADKGWVFLACPFEEEWRTLCRAIGRPELLEDPRFSTPVARREHDEELAGELAAVFAANGPLEWEKLLTAVDVACVRAEDGGYFHFFNDDPHIKENGFTVEIDVPRLGTAWRYGPVLTYSKTSTRVGPGPLRGQQTAAILREYGYSDEQIRDFKERGAVDWEEP